MEKISTFCFLFYNNIIMAVPKRKTSKSRRNMRNRANSKLAMPALSFCSHCQGPTKPHFACQGCGFYNGRFISL